MQREGYWDYMGRRLREDRMENQSMTHSEEAWKKEISQMQEQVHSLQMRVVDLANRIHDLTYKVEILGGDSKQLELKLNANI